MSDSDSGVTMMRRVRSFVRRQGRMTEGQHRLLEQLWPRYGIANDNTPLDLDTIFGRAAPHVVEIGFGMGDSLLQMAADAPEQDFLGIEVHRPGIARLLRAVDERRITNIRVICDDAVEVMTHRITSASLSAVHLFFPDPWPKKRHHKRRIVQPDFVDVIASRLRSGGVLHMATDWEEYAQQAMAVISACPLLHNRFGAGCFATRPETRPLTKFEQRGRRLGHDVWDLLYEKR
jgi:tRNA (guanine-N7-)-methyltransferase